MSPLRQALDDYLRLRRSLGFTLERHGRLLPSLVGHLESAGAATLTTKLALDWATALDGKPEEWAVRLSIARGFARYLQSLDPATEVPPAGVTSPPTACLPSWRACDDLVGCDYADSSDQQSPSFPAFRVRLGIIARSA